MNMNANDGLQNIVAELGTPKDKASAWTYTVRHQSNIELENIYRSSWLGRKIVDVPVDDMTRSWRTWHAEDTLVDRIEALGDPAETAGLRLGRTATPRTLLTRLGAAGARCGARNAPVAGGGTPGSG